MHGTLDLPANCGSPGEEEEEDGTRGGRWRLAELLIHRATTMKWLNVLAIDFSDGQQLMC